VQLVGADACLGLVESLAAFHPEARWQRSVVHFHRNVFSHVPATKLREVAAMPKAIDAQEDRAAAQAKATDVVVERRAQRLRTAAEVVAAHGGETPTDSACPEPHWRRVRTNDPRARIIREIRRRTRVVGAFPDGHSALHLAAARLRHSAGTRWSTRRHLDMTPLHHETLQTA
jgi:putative transposase